MGQGVDQNCPLGSGPWVTLPLLPAPFKLACAWMLSLKQTWRTTLCLHTILWYDQRATTPLHLRLLQQIKINLENSPALHPHNASSSLLTRFFSNPHAHQERQLTTPAFSVAVVSLQPGVVGSWLLEQAGFRYINVFQHWVIQSYFLLLHQSVCVYWVSLISISAIRSHWNIKCHDLTSQTFESTLRKVRSGQRQVDCFQPSITVCCSI